MDSPNDPWSMPSRNIPPNYRSRRLQDSPIFKSVFTITFILAFIIFFISIYGLFNPAHPGDLYRLSPVYFFLFLLESPVIGVDTVWVALVMAILFSIFFVSMLYLGVKRWKGPAFDNPMIYYGSMASFGLVSSLIIIAIEAAFGISIGGTTIETDIQQHPYLMYVQLIYAPFAEELGFRIIPLGLLTVYLVIKAGSTRKQALYSFLVPGLVRRKYGIRLTTADYVFVIATSLLFGYAHVFFGAWDPGKMVSTALVGAILAFGYLKFGLFVDIPIHWFFNGFSSVYLIVPSMLVPAGLSLFWTFLSGGLAIIFLIILYVERKRRGELKESPVSA